MTSENFSAQGHMEGKGAGLVDVVRRTPATVSGGSSRHVQRVYYGNASIPVDSAAHVNLVLNLSEGHRAWRRSEGRVTAADPFVGAMTLVPPGYPATFELSGMARVLMVQIPWDAVKLEAVEAGLDGACLELRTRLAYDDPELARYLYAAVSADDESKPIAAIIRRLIVAHSASPEALSPVKGGLSPTVLRRVHERIEAELEAPPTLDSLAAEANLSRFHFAREFRTVTGLSPHRYVLRRQLDRATIMLADRKLAVVDIAAATGFAHASHLARHLRRRTGLSPGAFRACVLN